MSYVYWLATAKEKEFDPWTPIQPGIAYIKGQKEQGETTGYVHWQLLFVLSNKQRLTWLRVRYPGVHFEPSRSDAADAYVWKDATAIAGTRFELGTKPIRRNKKTDWDKVRECARVGTFDDIPSDVYIRYYGNLQRICRDYLRPSTVERSCTVFWGPTGTGKSYRAWSRAGMEAYAKDPLTKWWCGYRGQRDVIIDEFRGVVNVSHILRWLDRYPVIVETKGGSVPLCAERFYITSNIHPREWWPELDCATLEAVYRRMEIIEVTERENSE